jgi:hypothetical protein
LAPAAFPRQQLARRSIAVMLMTKRRFDWSGRKRSDVSVDVVAIIGSLDIVFGEIDR